MLGGSNLLAKISIATFTGWSQAIEAEGVFGEVEGAIDLNFPFDGRPAELFANVATGGAKDAGDQFFAVSETPIDEIVRGLGKGDARNEKFCERHSDRQKKLPP